MSDEIEYIEPTQEHVGQMVEVRDNYMQEWRQRKLVGVISHRCRFVVEPKSIGVPIAYKCARIPSPKPQQAEKSPTKPIDWTKPVRTKDGRAVRVLCTDGLGDYPVIGLVDGERRCRTWTLDGGELTGTIGPCDLENAPQRIQREYWVNVYPSGIGYNETKYLADEVRTSNCLACVKITIDCEEGEGL